MDKPVYTFALYEAQENGDRRLIHSVKSMNPELGEKLRSKKYLLGDLGHIYVLDTVAWESSNFTTYNYVKPYATQVADLFDTIQDCSPLKP